jgi:hypothetical protein
MNKLTIRNLDWNDQIMKIFRMFKWSPLVVLVGCQSYNPYVKNERREFYIKPNDGRRSYVYQGDVEKSYKGIADAYYQKGMEDAKKLYSMDGEGGIYPHHQHREMQIRYVDAKSRHLGAGIKVEGGQIPVLVHPTEWMRQMGEPLPGTAKPKVIKKEEVLVDAISGEMK